MAIYIKGAYSAIYFEVHHEHHSPRKHYEAMQTSTVRDYLSLEAQPGTVTDGMISFS